MTLATDQKVTQQGLCATSTAMLALRDEVLLYWEQQVRDLVDGARDTPQPILINTLPAFFDNIAEALTPAYPRTDGTSNNTAMAAHGGERARMTRLRADQIIHEYQLFRDAIMVIAARHGLVFSETERRVLELSIDGALRESVREFSSTHENHRERLAAEISHDMRNPLGLIIGATQLIAICKDLDTARRVALKIDTGARRMENMLSALVDAFTFERKVEIALSISHFDILHLIQKLVGEIDVGAQVHVSTAVQPVPGYWCENSLRRAIENLLTNAAKYGDGSVVRIAAHEVLGRLILSVHNIGNPIAEEQRGKIFDYLERGNDTRGAGWGIGLPFVRAVAESHGGSVAVDSAPATGTTFIIDVPVDCRPYATVAGNDAPRQTAP